MDQLEIIPIKDIYNKIARDFDKTRYSIWNCVADFLNIFKSNSLILDIGCGNGKNMLSKTDLQFKGIDLSEELVKICINKGLDVTEADMTSIPFSDNTFDGFMAVASYHHLSTDESRTQALNEMYRILKPNGLGLIVVWAMEQPDDSRFNFTNTDEFVKWTDKKTKKTFNRYYHIYRSNDLVNEITKLEPRFEIKKQIWEKGNWCVVIQK